MFPFVPVLKGLLSYLPGFHHLTSSGTNPTISSRYCYSVWLRHLVLAAENGLSTEPRRVAELGPGGSIGVGIAALLTGSEHYYALDVVKYADHDRNLAVLEELIDLFKRQPNIPAKDEFPALRPILDSYAFPYHVLSKDRLSWALTDERIAAIRRALTDPENEARGNFRIQYVAPWHMADAIPAGTLDLIFSQAVLEHIDDLDTFYRLSSRWLKENGVMSHQIDFQCHNSASRWNGHWAYSQAMWALIRGKRAWLINRQPYSAHLAFHDKYGFQRVREVPETTPSQLSRSALAPEFQFLTNADLTTSGAFVQSVLRNGAPGLQRK
jgi:hypothetical protein